MIQVCITLCCLNTLSVQQYNGEASFLHTRSPLLIHHQLVHILKGSV